MKISTNKFLIILFFINLIVFPNGSIISKALKLLFVLCTLIYITKKKSFKWNKYFYWLIAFSGYACCSYFWATSKTYAWEGIKTILLNSLCIVMLLELMKKNSDWKKISFDCISILPVFMMIRLIFQYGFGVILDVREVSGQHNSLGMYCAFGVVFAIYQILNLKNKKTYIKFFMALDLILCVLTMSRKAIMYLALPIVIMLVITGKNANKKIRNFLILVASVLVGYLLITKVPILYQYVGRGLESTLNYLISGEGDASAAGRNTRILFGMRMFSQKPWFGWGAMNYNYLFSNTGDVTGMIVADNNFIDVAVNLGRIGLVIYYSVYVFSIFNFIKCKNKSNLILTFPVAILVTLLVSDYGVSSYLYLHSQTFLAIAVYMISEIRKQGG